jgi:hypothetical protein
MRKRGSDFWASVDKKGPLVRPELGRCWVWIAAIDKKTGYGRFGVRGTTKIGQAHRLAWIEKHCDPGKLCILHRCDNPPCVRESHLFLGTRDVNNKDMAAKGRANRGEARPLAKLTEKKVAAIRVAISEGFSQAALAKKYGVNQSQISRAATGSRWRHIGEKAVRTRRSGVRMTEKLIRAVRQGLARGETGIQLAVTLGCSTATISKIKNS